MQNLNQTQIGQVTVEGGSGALARLLDRVKGKLKRNSARVTYPITNAYGEIEMMTIAGRKIGAGLSDANNWLSALQFFARYPVVHIPLKIERGHRGVAWLVKPASAAQTMRLRWMGHNLVFRFLLLERVVPKQS